MVYLVTPAPPRVLYPATRAPSSPTGAVPGAKEDGTTTTTTTTTTTNDNNTSYKYTLSLYN